MKEPSRERGCMGKSAMSDLEKMIKYAETLVEKHNKKYGIYQCPHCGLYHMTTKLENSHLYAPLIYIVE